jgi:hypothetical protein
MRRIGVALAGIFALILFTGSLAQAGDYHRGATLICSDCHVMHGSQQHNYEADSSGFGTPAIGGAGPYTYLLRNEINAMCLNCHDGRAWAPDVFEANAAVGVTPVRQAGALNDTSSAGPDYYAVTGHTLYTTDTPPGSQGWAPDPNHGLTCVDCHSQHGRWDSYRNVNDAVGDNASGTFITRTVGNVFDPNGTQADVHQYGALTFNYDDVDFPEPDATASGYAEWCGGCHADFHGGATSVNIGGSGTPPEHFERHPVAGVDIGAVGGGHSRTNIFADPNKLNWVQVMSPTGRWRPTDSADVVDQTPSCMSCHKGHGNKNAFGLLYMDRYAAGGVTEEGAGSFASTDEAYKALCKQCHSQG